MFGYWIRHRSVITIILCVAVALVSVLFFAFPQIEQQANYINTQSIYKNSDVDFIAPEPSYEQVTSLPGTNGIATVFPYFMTKTKVQYCDSSRTTTVLLSDQCVNLENTMYNEKRLIEKSNETFENPAYVDWQFCHDTSTTIGEDIKIAVGGSEITYTIYAIYETNSIYDGGAIVVPISTEQKETIAQNSKNNGYSGMFVIASDYSVCKTFLTTEYRPLGRLKTIDQFESEEQYQLHYDAIMSSGYANEITDFRIKESSAEGTNGQLNILMCAAIVFAILIVFNLILINRGCEKSYFAKFCIPKGKKVMAYYNISFVIELLLFCCAYFVVLMLQIKYASIFIPDESLGYQLIIVPAIALLGEVISRIINGKVIKAIPVKKKS